ncbi:bifunctional folylpolyglutamate synthase/dihydrofolate synthase [Thermodesulfobacterium sp. TA1]|uniref:bifunctional folylpolyglutamate synthase/dihydrofolate synthase n=1 Tax=Thermodesulfobacterium sp. TA1 TaxID=2234087 RepID=UPI001232D509|nr:folylpolyglutamate synthase/dihydrofolate synthase family protein [Thermodesulfobacterium sp. TA1]QER42097.1 bifunctional folylpolyglutamate synthase/dihydrofolate synthase [Thermodesulfobacterium sp. TA1]
MSSILTWLYNLGFHRIRPGLTRITKVLARLGNPQKKLKIIHVAGTNGKGSTSAILAELLKHQGFKVGLYTSPHLFKLNERFKVNGQDIPDEILESLIKEVKEKSQDLNLTFFEVTTAVAFLYFFQEKVDFAVIECGMGGRLDATNVIFPKVSIITNVGLEHTKYLGDTLEKIAYEKAGIIKRGVPCVLGNIKPQALPVFLQRLSQVKAQGYFLNKDFRVIKNKQLWDYHGEKTFKNMFLNLLGDYQGENLGCALKTLEILENNKFLSIDEKAVRKALKQVRWKGRYEKIKVKTKEFLIDVAHNLDGVEALVKDLIAKEGYKKRFLLILGVTNEDGQKPYLDMFLRLEQVSKKTYICEFPSQRKIVSLVEWKQTLKNKAQKVEFFSSPDKALKSALNEEITKVLVTGSIYFVAEFLKTLTLHLET